MKQDYMIKEAWVPLAAAAARAAVPLARMAGGAIARRVAARGGAKMVAKSVGKRIAGDAATHAGFSALSRSGTRQTGRQTLHSGVLS